MKTVNLEEILSKVAQQAAKHGKYSEFDSSELFVIFKAMKEACRQTLELAADNAELGYYEYVEDWMVEPFNMTQDDLGNIHAINKSSITNTINQIE